MISLAAFILSIHPLCSKPVLDMAETPLWILTRHSGQLGGLFRRVAMEMHPARARNIRIRSNTDPLFGYAEYPDLAWLNENGGLFAEL